MWLNWIVGEVVLANHSCPLELRDIWARKGLLSPPGDPGTRPVGQ